MRICQPDGAWRCEGSSGDASLNIICLLPAVTLDYLLCKPMNLMNKLSIGGFLCVKKLHGLMFIVCYIFSEILQKGVDKVQVFRYIPICTTFQTKSQNKETTEEIIVIHQL